MKLDNDLNVIVLFNLSPLCLRFVSYGIVRPYLEEELRPINKIQSTFMIYASIQKLPVMIASNIQPHC